MFENKTAQVCVHYKEHWCDIYWVVNLPECKEGGAAFMLPPSPALTGNSSSAHQGLGGQAVLHVIYLMWTNFFDTSFLHIHIIHL